MQPMDLHRRELRHELSCQARLGIISVAYPWVLSVALSPGENTAQPKEPQQTCSLLLSSASSEEQSSSNNISLKKGDTHWHADTQWNAMSDSTVYFLISLFPVFRILYTLAPRSHCNAMYMLGFISVVLSALCSRWCFLFKSFNKKSQRALGYSPLVAVARLERQQNDI